MPISLTDLPLILALGVIVVLAVLLHRRRREIEHVQIAARETEQKIQMLELLSGFEHAISEDLELNPLCEKIVATLSELAEYPCISLYLLDDHALKLHSAVGIEHPVEQLPLDQGVGGRVIRSGETEHITDMDQDPLFSRIEEQVGTSIWTPLSNQEQVLGVVIVGAPSQNAFTEMDVHFMDTIGRHLKDHVIRVQSHMEISGRGRQYQSVIDNVDEVIFRTDNVGYWSFLNAAWTEYTGESIEDSLGNSVLEYVYPDDQRDYLTAFAPLLSGNSENCRCEFRIVHEEDRLVWVEMHARPVHGEEGAITGAFGTLINVTDRKYQGKERRGVQNNEVEVVPAVDMERTSAGGKILLMDDERIVRSLVSDILTHSGYEVVLTEDGAEAVQAYTDAMTSEAPFDVVMLDLTVPGGMGGKEALNRILMADPDALVIVSSGYVNNPILANYRKYGFIGMVPKPYQADHLTRVMDEVIATGQASA